MSNEVKINPSIDCRECRNFQIITDPTKRKDGYNYLCYFPTRASGRGLTTLKYIKDFYKANNGKCKVFVCRRKVVGN